MSGTEIWLDIHGIKVHIENDGPYALRHGLQPREEIITFEQAAKDYRERLLDLLKKEVARLEKP